MPKGAVEAGAGCLAETGGGSAGFSPWRMT
jgi:hypothetical protein